MANKIKVKVILELRAAQMSQREICRTRHISQHSVTDVFRIANEKVLKFEDVRDKTDVKEKNNVEGSVSMGYAALV